LALSGQVKAATTNIGKAAEISTPLLNQLTHLLLLYQEQMPTIQSLGSGDQHGAYSRQCGFASGSTRGAAPWPLSLEATIQERLQLREEIQASLAEASVY